MTIWTKTKPGRYERQPRCKVIPYRLYRQHRCVTCGEIVLPCFDNYQGHCLRCGVVKYVSMLAADAELFQAYFTQPAAQ